MSTNLQLLTDEQQKLLEHTIVVRRRLEEQYSSLPQQNDTAALGMWLFLATEIMFFGTLFTALIVYRFLYAAAFEAASVELNWKIGAVNTVVLLVSSLMMALVVSSIRMGRKQAVVFFLLATAALGACFLALKGYEYFEDYQRGLVLGSQFSADLWLTAGLTGNQLGHVQLFLLLYWIMTAAHALHMIVGISAVLIIVAVAYRRHFDEHYYGPIEVTGLYWHFVDVVWIFLFPMLYLLGTHRT